MPRPSRQRLALLILGLVAAQSTILARIARELHALAVTAATTADHVERRLRRTLNDPFLLAEERYTPALAALIPWPRRPGARLVLAIDESSQDARCHLFRVALPYWGHAIPLVWTLWPQNVALPAGSYWALVTEVLARLAAVLPAGMAVWIVADRGYAAPALLDAVAARGWHWLVRLPVGSHRFRDAHGQEGELRTLLRRYVNRPGQRWKATGWLFKDAGWRAGRQGKRSRSWW